jgi:hypothetical protein
LLSAICAIGMLLGALSATTCALGASLYLTVQGLSFATYSALTLELVGRAGRSAATRQTGGDGRIPRRSLDRTSASHVVTPARTHCGRTEHNRGHRLRHAPV